MTATASLATEGANVRPTPGDRSAAARAAILLLIVASIAMAIASLALGPALLSPGDVLDALLHPLGHDAALERLRTHTIVHDIRLPRTALGLMVGGGLAVAGGMMQGLFRNPLADPALVGVSAGAALAAAAAIVLGAAILPLAYGYLQQHLISISAFFGGLATTVTLYLIATREGRTSVATMLLAGIAIGAFCAAGTGFLVFMSNDLQLRDITYWTLGSLSGSTWEKTLIASLFILPVLVLAPAIGNALNALQLGESEAMHLGFEVQRVKRLVILLVAMAVGASVAVSGVIGFVGIVVPHLLRLAIGPDNRFLLLASALLGGVLLLAADLIARLIVAPAELPIGIVTAAVGSPFFLWLLLRRRVLLDL